MPHTTTGTLLGAGLLCLGVAVSQVRAGIALPVATIAAIAAITQGNPTPWTLLDPVWTTWQQWLALSVGTGFLLGSAGFGGWAEGRPAIPGWRRGPWVTVGLGTLLFAMGVTAWAQQFEVGDLATTPLPALLAIVVATGWGDREELPTWSGVFGLLAVYLWLCSPLAPNMALFWTLTLLLPPVLGACLLAYQARGAVRVQMAGTAVLGLGALGLGWPGFGASATAAAMAMLPLLLVLWTGGTHVALRRSA
ncbi:MAG: hypothetical protein KC912_02630 [Proteobacteria bacterium]|nr:hypothetical protein [Pseudomonadota bacterium]